VSLQDGGHLLQVTGAFVVLGGLARQGLSPVRGRGLGAGHGGLRGIERVVVLQVRSRPSVLQQRLRKWPLGETQVRTGYLIARVGSVGPRWLAPSSGMLSNLTGLLEYLFES